MTFLPIVERELRVRARLRSTYRFRTLAASSAFLLVLLLLMVGGRRGGTAGQYGALVFHALAWAAFVFCLLEGARNTADCLSEEKRAGTLGLLFLTDLRPYDVVLGKLMATSLNSVYGLLAIVPPMAIPLLIGGVTFDEFWRLVLVLLNTLFFSLSLGLLFSSALRDERRAWSGMVGSVIAWAVLPALLLLHPRWAFWSAAALSPMTGFLTAFDAAYALVPGRYWSSVWWVHLLSWACLAGAAVVLPHTWQDQATAECHSWWRRFFPRRDSSPPVELARRTMVLDGNPAVWLVVRGQKQSTLLWLVVVGASICSVGAWILSSGASLMAASILGVILLLHFALAVWVATEACHLLGLSRDSGALELLLCTPLPAKQIVEGHLEGLRQRFLRPVATLVTVEVVLLAAQVYLLGAADQPLGLCIAVLIVVGLCLAGSLLDLVAVARFGLWQGLANRKPARAVTKTVLYVLVIPFVAAVLLGGILLPVISLVKNLVFINYAQERMRRHFRALVTERFGWADEPDLVDHPKKRRPVNPLPPVLTR